MVLRKRGKYFYLDVRIEGKRTVKTLRTKDRTIARLRAQHLVAEMDKTFIPSRITVEEFTRGYLEWAATRKAPGTVESDRQRLERFIEAAGVKYLGDVTLMIADRFVTELATTRISAAAGGEATGLSPATVNGYIRTLRAIFSQAKRWGYIGENPFSQVQKITEEQRVPRVLSLDEYNRIVAQLKAQHPQLVPLIQFYVLTGARRSEALALQWPDVLFEKGILIFRKTKGKDAGRRKLRIIPMSPSVSRLLSARRELSRPFNFLGDFVSKSFVEAARAAGIQDVSLHDLRRTFGTYLAEAGLSPFGVQQLMGHSDVKTTMEHYIHIQDPALLERMKEIDRLLASDRPKQ